MRTLHILSMVVLAVTCVAGQGGGKPNLLENGDFESGMTPWWESYPRGMMKVPPRYERVKEGVHGGKWCAQVTVTESGTYSSLANEIPKSKDAKFLHLEGWVGATENVMLHRAHGDYWLTESSGEAVDPWIEFSFPFPFETQTPLVVKVTTEPPDRVASLEIIPDAENRHLRVHLKPGERGSKCNVRYEALVAVRDRPRGKGEKAVFAERSKLPSEVAWFFEKTPGIDPDDPGIQAVAKTFKTDTLEHAIEGALAWLRANMKPISGGDQGGKATFERKGAPCTGHANLAASLFQAAGLPCRVLGCLMGARLQEHYIVELWTPAEGWRRVEATGKAFPIADSLHLILHVAHPSFFRSEGNVPLHCRTADGCRGNWLYGKDQSWQGMSPVGSLPFAPSESAALEKAARDSFKAWEKKPALGGSAVLLGSEAVKKLAPKATTLLEVIADWEKR